MNQYIQMNGIETLDLNKLYKILLVIFIFIILVGVVSSAPKQQNFATGYFITPTPQDYLIEGETYTLNFFVYNISNGYLINNDSVECNFYLANQTGDVSVVLDSNYISSSKYWYINISADNLTKGTYYYGIKCNNTDSGGSTTGKWYVTNSGTELTQGRAILYVGLLGLLIFALFGTMFFISRLPDDNIRGEEGNIIKISYLKYLRTPCWLIVYFLFIAIMFVGSNLAFNFMGAEELIAKILFSIYTVLFTISPVIVIMLGAWILVKIVQDKEIWKELERGIMGGKKF